MPKIAQPLRCPTRARAPVGRELQRELDARPVECPPTVFALLRTVVLCVCMGGVKRVSVNTCMWICVCGCVCVCVGRCVCVCGCACVCVCVCV